MRRIDSGSSLLAEGRRAGHVGEHDRDRLAHFAGRRGDELGAARVAEVRAAWILPAASRARWHSRESTTQVVRMFERSASRDRSPIARRSRGGGCTEAPTLRARSRTVILARCAWRVLADCFAFPPGTGECCLFAGWEHRPVAYRCDCETCRCDSELRRVAEAQVADGSGRQQAVGGASRKLASRREVGNQCDDWAAPELHGLQFPELRVHLDRLGAFDIPPPGAGFQGVKASTKTKPTKSFGYRIACERNVRVRARGRE